MRVFGVSVVGIIVATLLYYIFEFFWYGVAFQDAWQIGNGVSESDYQGNEIIWMAVGFMAPLAQVIALAFILKWFGWPSLAESINKILLLAILMGAGTSIYMYAYMPHHSTAVFLIDWFHIIIGWLIAAIVLTFLRPKYIAPVKKAYQTREEPEVFYED